MLGKTIDSIKPPLFVKPQANSGTLRPLGHLWQWERAHPFNRFEHLGTPIDENLWADYLVETFEWLTRRSLR